MFPVQDNLFHSSAEEFVWNAEVEARYAQDSCRGEEKQQDAELAALPAAYLELERPLESHIRNIGVQMDKLHEEVQLEVGTLKAGQKQAQRDIAKLQATQEQVLARLESVLAAVGKLQA